MVVHRHKEAHLDSEITKKFYDIINQEDWNDVDPLPEFNHAVPIGNIIIPTPLNGIIINLAFGIDLDSLGEIDLGEDYA